MRKAKSYAFLLTLILALALLIMPFGALSVSAAESTDTQVTATTSASVKQGNSGYCYVYIDSLESLSTLSVTVHYDADKVKVQSGYVYNSVSSLLNDKSVSESSVQFSYIFDGKGKAEKTQLFYFRYTVLSDAEVGDTYFDIVVNEAYDSSLQPINVSGSRCAFKVAETVTTKTCSIYSSSSVGASVGEEFEISYRLSTYQIASGSFTVSYDPELFEVVGVTNGAFCDNKIVDVNTKLAGSVYVSFVGTEYKSNTNLITVKFKTLKNVAEKSTIKMAVTEFYDLALNPISCSGYTTTANIAFDETYTEDAPSMTLQTAYNAEADKVTLTIKLDRDSMLGAGDFVLKFNTNYLTYSSSEKGFSPTFFNINDKNVSDGILKFSIISLSNITNEEIVLTVTFDVKHACEDKLVDFEISGSGLTDALTNTIVLNFVDASVTIPLKHTAATATTENRVEPTCTADGRYDSVVYCSVCDTELSRETKTIDKLGHDYTTEWTVDVEPTCTTTGSKSHHCSRCGDKAEVTVIPANGHSYGDWYTITAPTCVLTGVDEHECSVCHHKETKTTNALGHTASAAVEEKRIEPTCTVNGSYDSVVYCSVCNAELSRENKAIDKLGHDHSTEWTIDLKPTCTTEGSKSHHCSRCGDKADIAVIPANGHTNAEAVIENKVEATCTVDGRYDSVIYCSACGDELSREAQIISKLGHTYSEEWTIDLAPTCTEKGSKSHHCIRGDAKADVTEVAALGHKYDDWYETKATTCTETGTEAHKCSVCQYTETRTVNALGHTEADAVVENKVNATCTTDGSYDNVVYCSVCEAEVSREAQTIEKLGHTESDAVVENKVNATCTVDGSYDNVVYCSVCEAEVSREVQTIKKLGHTEADAVVENKVDATCTTNGSYDSVVYCSVCDAEVSREAQVINKLGHDYFEEWTIDLAPTCTEKGSKSHHCTRCESKADVTEIPVLEHTYKTNWIIDATSHWKECACGEKNEIAEHIWNNGEVTKAPSVDAEGVKTYTCTLCSYAKTESIPKFIINIENVDAEVTLEVPTESEATIPEGTTIEIIEKSEEHVSDEILGELAETSETVVTTLGVYDLNLVLDGVKIQPGGVVVVTLPAPKLTGEYDRIIVVYIASDGSYEECKTTVNADGTISFETEHFSKYAVIGINEEEGDKGLGTGAIVAIIIGSVLVVSIGGFTLYWFVIKRKTWAELVKVFEKLKNKLIKKPE